MKFGVVVFPGSNCDRDMIGALEKDLSQQVQTLWHGDTSLGGLEKEDCIVLPGGFSYGDYLRCGAIARFSPMMQSVISFANNGGKVLGVCNGFQILCESGLLPGVLLANAAQKFVCKNVFIKDPNDHSAQPLMIPIAHGEGRYYAEDAVLRDLKKNKQVIYQYCNSAGELHDQHNPNGAANHIAGICNTGRNVFGMMPHPERACSNDLGNTDGREVFRALLGVGEQVESC